jgi:uncharacterized protein YbjT (DUF2867 family)
MNSVLVAGATGLVGSELVKQLCGLDTCSKITVLSRRPLKIVHPKIDNRLIDFDRLPDLALDCSYDACFCCLGTTQKKMGREGMVKVDYEYVLELGKLCVQHEIPKYLIVSSQMANPRSASFYMRTKGQMEVAVRKLNIPTIAFLRPSLLVGEREEYRWAEHAGYYIYRFLSPLMVGRLRKMRAITGQQVAKAMIAIASKIGVGQFVYESDELELF